MVLSEKTQRKIKRDARRFHRLFKEYLSVEWGAREILGVWDNSGTQRWVTSIREALDLPMTDEERDEKILSCLVSAPSDLSLQYSRDEFYDRRRSIIRGVQALGLDFDPFHSEEVWESFFGQMEGKEIVIKREDTLTLKLPLPSFTLGWRGLRGVSFRNLSVAFTLKKEALYCKILHGRNKIHLGATSLKHPHVHRGKICFGAGATGAEAALNRKDIIGLYSLVLATLRTYNKEGAYQALCNFTDQRGGRCGNPECLVWIPQEKIGAVFSCPRCKVTYCLKCSKESKIHEKPLRWCHICGPNEVNRDTWVGKRICEYCQALITGKKLFVCSICGKSSCAAHTYACMRHGCGNKICRSCYVKKCPVCRAGYCLDHQSKIKRLEEYGICLDCEGYYPERVEEFLEKQRKNEGKDQ